MARCLWPAGYTNARQILEHDFEVFTLPQISVHFNVTDGMAYSVCRSPLWSMVLTWASVFHGAWPGCSTAGCLSLLHSWHSTGFQQSLATWVDDAQHLKQMCFSFRYAFLSSRVLFLKLRHFLNGWGLLCSGHCLSGSSCFLTAVLLSKSFLTLLHAMLLLC